MQRHDMPVHSEIDAAGAGQDAATRHQAILDSVFDGIVTIDEHGIIESFNAAAERIFQYDAEEVVGQNVSILMPAPHREQHDGYLARYGETGERKIIGIGREVTGRRKDGSIFPLDLAVTEVQLGDRRIFSGVLRDITARKEAERQLARVRRHLQNVIDSMPSVLIGVDPSNAVTDWNAKAEALTGIPAAEAMGKPLDGVLAVLGDQIEDVMSATAADEPKTIHRLPARIGDKLHYFDAVTYPLVANGTPGSVIRLDDITARVRVEEMMLQTEKMASVGTLAAGMAHEINNPLGAVLQGCQNVLRRVSPDLAANRATAEELRVDLDALYAYLEQRQVLRFLHGVRESASRAARIVADMLAFTRRSDLEVRPVLLADVIETALRLAHTDYDLKRRYDFRHIRIVRDYDPTLKEVICEASKIEQVVLNLVKNSAQALASSDSVDEPTITLRTMRDGAHAQLEVADNGPGMSEEVRRRVFEPFFTTKETGVGTGLGLSVSYSIITQQHGGAMSVESAPGRGTTMVVRLPIEGRSR